jgi:hypothetical protein
MELMTEIENTTSITIRADTKARHVTNPSLSTTYNLTCNAFYFPLLDEFETVVSETPQKIGTSFACGVAGNSTKQSNHIYFNSTQIANVEARLNNATDLIFIMVIPNYTAGFVSGLGSDSFGVEKYIDRLTFVGEGFDCTVIPESNMCGWLENPWPAVRKMLGADFIGDWFYVFIWFPFPMVFYLMTRNGTYAGFLGLGIMLVIETIDPVIFEVALSMITICAAFTFYETFRHKLFGAN